MKVKVAGWPKHFVSRARARRLGKWKSIGGSVTGCTPGFRSSVARVVQSVKLPIHYLVPKLIRDA